MTGMTDHTDLILDGTKIAWHQDRIDAWERGERIANALAVAFPQGDPPSESCTVASS